jgi:malate dehydrogenase (quinone)
MDSGTDVNFGAISRKLIHWLSQQPNCGVATGHRVVGLKRVNGRWNVDVRSNKGNRIASGANFVFIGAGGGSLQLLQMSGIQESKGFGGFPIGGQWLVCDKPDIVAKHQAKVYGQALGAAPTMAVPHLDTRVIDGKKSLLFGPYAAWTTKFLHRHGSFFDLPGSIKFDNIGSLVKVGLYNLPLVRYLIQQGTQSMNKRMEVLRDFYPEARNEDWRLIDAGIRVQAIKKEDGQAGIVHYGTEVVTDAERSISALLGASPGASVSVHVMLEVIRKCFSSLLESESGRGRMKEMIPSFDEDLKIAQSADRFAQLDEQAEKDLFG